MSPMRRAMERVEPGPGQESVWDYPRPPRLEPTDRHIEVMFNKAIIADTRNAKRVLETSHPPGYYIPREDVRIDLLRAAPDTSWCEWKGVASYYDIVVDGTVAPRAAWTYPNPVPAFARIQNHIAFYPSRVDRCMVDGEIVRAQDGDFYGGWITCDIVGPFKGAAGTRGW